MHGTLKPQAAAVTVKVEAFRRIDRKWKLVKSHVAAITDARTCARYSAEIRLAKAGRYRFKAVTAGTAEWLSARTGFSRTLTVK